MEVLIIAALFGHRMSLDIASSREFEGPFGLYTVLRNFLRSEFMPDFVREGVDCPYCVGFWAALFAAFMLYAFHTTLIVKIVIVGVAASALPAIMYQLMESMHGIAARDL